MPVRLRLHGWLWLGVLLGASRAPGGSRAEGPLRFLPSDTKVVLTIHAASLGDEEKKNGLELIRQLYFDRLTPELPRGEKLPITEVSRVYIAWPAAGTLYSVVVVHGKIDRPLLEKQCRAAAKASKLLTVETMGTGKPAVPVFRRKLEERLWTDLFPQLEAVPAALRKVVAPQDVYVAALDDETLFVSLAGKRQMERAVRARPATTQVRTSDELTKLLKKQDPKDVASFAMLDDSLSPALQLVVNEAVKETFDQFEHITARVRGSKEIEIVIQVKSKTPELQRVVADKSEETLKILRTHLETLVPDAKRRVVADALLKAFRVGRKDAVVTLTGKLSREDARKLLPVVSEKKER